VERVARVWQDAFRPGARHWTLEDVDDGMVDEASAQLALDIDPVAHPADMRDAKGELRYHDLTVADLGTLPPVRHVNGTAIFAGKRLQFLPTAGALKGLKSRGGS